MPILRSAIKAWRGEEKLWIVFWGWLALYKLLASAFWYYVGPATIGLIEESFPNGAVEIVFLMTIVIHMGSFTMGALQTVFLWKCAKNSHSSIWFWPARIVAVLLGLLFIAGLIVFVQTYWSFYTLGILK